MKGKNVYLITFHRGPPEIHFEAYFPSMLSRIVESLEIKTRLRIARKYLFKGIEGSSASIFD